MNVIVTGKDVKDRLRQEEIFEVYEDEKKGIYGGDNLNLSIKFKVSRVSLETSLP